MRVAGDLSCDACLTACLKGREEPGADRLPVDQAEVERCLPEVEQRGLRRSGGDPHPQQPGVEARPRPLQQVHVQIKC